MAPPFPLQTRVVDVEGVPTEILFGRSNANSAMDAPCDAVLTVIPGNPGLVDFYTEYISFFLRNAAQADGVPRDVGVVVVGHAGHFPQPAGSPSPVYSLKEQIGHKRAFVRRLLATEGEAQDAAVPFRGRSVVLAGHSVGAHICLQLVREFGAERVPRACLLFPTIHCIADTPNGRRLRPLFGTLRPAVAWTAHALPSLPRSFLHRIVSWHLGLPTTRETDADNSAPQLTSANGDVEDEGAPHPMVRGAVRLLDYGVVDNCLGMAKTEMDEIGPLDHALVAEHVDRLVFYYGAEDRWVPPEHADAVERAHPTARVVRCEEGISHAFVVDGAESMGRKTWQWFAEAVGVQ